MADKKISQLTALSAANLAPSTDVLAIVDTSATETKKIAAQDIVNGVLNVASAVGIGTASPAEKLTVAGNIKLGTSGTSYLYGPATNGRSFIANSDGTAYMGIYGSAYGSGLDSIISFVAGTTNSMTFNASGNLGIGVTPSAWRSTSKALQIGQGASFWANTANPYAFMSSNAFLNSSAQDIYIVNGHATTYTQQVGQHIWYTAASGTINTAISFTQAMTLDASGNLGVGTTSPSSFGLLAVVKDQTADTAIVVSNGGTVNAATTMSFALFDSGAKQGWFRRYRDGSANTEIGFSDALLFTGNVTGTKAERARITAGGYFKASNDGSYANSTAAYHELRTSAADYSAITSNSNASPYGAYFWFSAADPNNTTNLFLLCNGWNGSTNVTRATIRSNGGLANYQANDVNLSDERTKKDIARLGSMWAKIKALEIVTFKYKDQTHDDDNIGLIAQQVESVAPEFVDVDGWGETPEDGVPLKSIYTADMYHAAIKALQEAMARIESLEAKVAALEAK